MEHPHEPILRRFAAGDTPVNIALMHLLMNSSAPEAVDATLDRVAALPGGGAFAPLRDLWRENRQAWATVRAVLGEAESGGQDPARWAAVFDRLAATAPEAGVALYGLGSPDLLAAATDEVVRLLRGWGVTGPGRSLLEIGCGYGRLSLALANDVASGLGLDISAGMIAEARRRAADLPHLRFAQSDGQDLAAVPSGTIDLVLAADVFPYLVASGPDGAARHVTEAARALRPGGTLAIFNWSYRGDDGRDRADAAAAFRTAGLSLDRAGTQDLALWDARAFVGRKPA